MTAHVQQASILSGRSMTLIVVMGLHALLIAALIAIQITPEKDFAPAAIKVVNVPPEVLPPPEKVKPKAIIPPKFQFVVPVIDPPNIEAPPESQVIELPTTDSGPSQVGPDVPTQGVLTAPPARVFTELKYRAVKSPDEFYPPASAALQEQGVAVVQVCVDGGGRIDGQPTIQTSSGYKRLDQAAIKWTREALRFTPATENAVGVRSCKGFRVTFNLN